jgi:hypothetical protein
MSRNSKSKDHTKALNIPLTLTQGDLLQEALAVTFAKDQTQAYFLAVDCLTMERISILLPPDYILKKKKLLTLREAHEFTRCVTRSLVLCVCFTL